MEIGDDGLPVTARRRAAGEDSGEHGIGLRSVKAIVDKYNGFMNFESAGEEFVFRAALFPSAAPEGPAGKAQERARGGASGRFPGKAVSTLLMFGLAAVLIVSFSPSTAKALSSLLSVRLYTVRFGWGDTSLDAEAPEFTGEGADQLNQSVESYMEKVKEKFWWYVSRKYDGYVAEDTVWNILRDDESLLCVRIDTTLNMGGSVQFCRCITLDKRTGEVLSLGDLFEEDFDYIDVISREILRQMEYQNEHEGVRYFLPGGIWSEEECFSRIDPDQNFYLDENGRLAIVFDEYQVAPGSMGMPEFVIPAELLSLREAFATKE